MSRGSDRYAREVSQVRRGTEGGVVPHTELLRRPSPRQEEQTPIDWNVGGEINGWWRFCCRFLKARGVYT